MILATMKIWKSKLLKVHPQGAAHTLLNGQGG